MTAPYDQDAWQHEWSGDGPPVVSDHEAARREAAAGERAWRAGVAEADAEWAAMHGHPYRRAALTGAVAGEVFRNGLGGLFRVGMILALVVVFGIVLALTLAATTRTGSDVLTLAMFAGIVWLIRRVALRHRAGR